MTVIYWLVYKCFNFVWHFQINSSRNKIALTFRVCWQRHEENIVGTTSHRREIVTKHLMLWGKFLWVELSSYVFWNYPTIQVEIIIKSNREIWSKPLVPVLWWILRCHIFKNFVTGCCQNTVISIKKSLETGWLAHAKAHALPFITWWTSLHHQQFHCRMLLTCNICLYMKTQVWKKRERETRVKDIRPFF